MNRGSLNSTDEFLAGIIIWIERIGKWKIACGNGKKPEGHIVLLFPLLDLGVARKPWYGSFPRCSESDPNPMDQSADPNPMDQTDKSLDPSPRHEHICMVALHPPLSPIHCELCRWWLPRSKPSCLWQACFEVLAAVNLGSTVHILGMVLALSGGNECWGTFFLQLKHTMQEAQKGHQLATHIGDSVGSQDI